MPTNHDLYVCWFETAQPDMSPEQWAALLKARESKGSMLNPQESLAAIHSVVANDDHL